MIDTTTYRRPNPRQRIVPWVIGLALGVAALVAVLLFVLRPPAPPPQAAAEPTAPAASPAATPAPAPAPVAETPAPEPKTTAAPLEADGIRQALIDLLGAKPVTTMFQLDEFARRFVTTVDNLGREQAPASLWPLNPTPGRFAAVTRDGVAFIDPDNGARYTPFVLLAEKVDAAAAVAFYVRALPLLQRAYEDLGYPNRRFHTRLLAVIDQLLATPEAPDRVPVTLTEVNSPVPSQRPWVRYEFADPAWQSASAGQKIMLRVGAVNQRRLKARLREIRAELLRQSAG